jgi:hypothetical protein
VLRISFPVRRFPAPGDHHAGPATRTTHPCGHGGGQVHSERNRTDYAGGMVHQPNEVAQVGLADQVDHALQARVPVALFPALDKGNLSLEMIDDLLVTGRVPPLGREIILAARDNDPKAVR